MSNTQHTPLSDEYFREMADLLVKRLATRQPGETDQKLVYITLKEVSRNTRHLCAEVRVSCPYDTPGDSKAFLQGQEEHADACMNVGGKV